MTSNISNKFKEDGMKIESEEDIIDDDTSQDVEIPHNRRYSKNRKMSAGTATSSSVQYQQQSNKAEDISPLFYGSESDTDESVELGAQFVSRAQFLYVEHEDPLNDCDIFSMVQESPIASVPRSTITATEEAAGQDYEAAEDNKYIFEWQSCSKVQNTLESRREKFDATNSGAKHIFFSPYDAFVAIWNEQYMEKIVEETNIYAHQLPASMLKAGKARPNSRITRWRDTTVDEMYAYLAILLAMSVIVKTTIKDYWSATQDIFSTPGFAAHMTYNRFILLNKCLHFRNNKSCDPKTMSRAEAKLFKVQPILDHINNKFSQLYNMGHNIVLDESLTMWKGRPGVNDSRNKVTTDGIKTYEVCDAVTGYFWRFFVYTGRKSRVKPKKVGPLSATIPTLVLRLLTGLERKGHTVWMDHEYNSPALARELKSRGLDCAGTLGINRQFVPPELSNLTQDQMVSGKVYGWTSGDVDVIVWWDTRRVGLITTYHGIATVNCSDTTKPKVINDYNTCLGGIDRRDQTLAAYPVQRKRIKVWYKSLFRRLLNASVWNAYIMYNQNYPVPHRDFRLQLVLELLSRHAPPAPPAPRAPLPASSVHCPGHLGHLRRQCRVCRKRVNTVCRTWTSRYARTRPAGRRTTSTLHVSHSSLASVIYTVCSVTQRGCTAHRTVTVGRSSAVEMRTWPRWSFGRQKW